MNGFSMTVLAHRESLKFRVTDRVDKTQRFTPRKLAEFAAEFIKGIVARGGTIKHVNLDSDTLFTWLFDVRFVGGAKHEILLESSPSRDHAVLSIRDQQYLLKTEDDLATVLGPIDPSREQSWGDRFKKYEREWAASLPSHMVWKR